MRFIVILLIGVHGLITDRQISQLVWCGASLIYTREDETVPQFEGINEEKVVFALTESHSVYQSHDSVWQQIEGEFDDIQVSPANSRVIYLFGKKSYRSNDCGENFVELNTTNYYNFKLNKMNWRWLIAYKQMECEHEDMNCREPFNNWLHYSNDGGLTWETSFQNVRDASWDKVLEDQEVPDQRLIICFSKESKSQIAFSDDFHTYQTLLFEGQGYFQTPQYLFVLSPDKDAYQLYYGSARLDQFQLNSLELPIQIYKEYSYTILDTDSGKIFISVSHFQDEQQLTNIYVSNQDGQEFKLALLNNVRSTENGNCDFEKLLGLSQVYVANIYDIPNQKAEDLQKTTVISFDGSKSWDKIRAPSQDSLGNPTNCGGDCSLHLVGRTDSYQSTLYTSEQSPGIAISVGSIGTHITDQLNTYLSKDGGKTWKEIKKGPFVYEITDFGGLILLADDQNASNIVYYSIDYGDTWQQKVIYDDLLYIQNIATEASGTERYFLIYGKTDSGEGFVLKVDFSHEFKRECSVPIDYEYWNQSCLDGSQTRYMRKKIDSNCFNPKQLITKRFVEPCPCTKFDWTCAPGYTRNFEGGECQTTSSHQDNCVPGKMYMKSQGYIRQNQCSGGVDLGPIEVLCPGVEETQQIFLVLVAALLVLFCIMAGYRMLRRQITKEINCQQQIKPQYNQMEFDEEEEDHETML